jgi:hypothetical protein
MLAAACTHWGVWTYGGHSRGRVGPWQGGTSWPIKEFSKHALKEECLWLQEWTSPFALTRALGVWITDYNEHYLHSALGYQSPSQFERQYYLSHETPFAAA